MARLTGAMPAIVTPFKGGEVDLPALQALVEWQLAEGASGIVACGTTGEGATLSGEETLAVARACAEVIGGRAPLIVGSGSNDTARTVALTQALAEQGQVDAALVVTPYYNKPSPAGVKAHYGAVAAQGGLPVLMYNVPGRTGLNMSVEAIVECGQIPGVIGVKEASAELDKALLIRQAMGADFTLLSGDDFTILPFLACGGDGVITVVGNVAPGPTARLIAAFQEGALAEAQALQARLLPLIQALFVEANPIPVKHALAAQGRLELEYRLPLVPPSPGAAAKVDAAWRAFEGAA